MYSLSTLILKALCLLYLQIDYMKMTYIFTYFLESQSLFEVTRFKAGFVSVLKGFSSGEG